MNKEEFERKLNDVQERLVSLRGNIINASIQIETLLDAILTNHYIPSEIQSSFLTKFLSDEYCTAGLKIRVFEKIGLSKSEYKGFNEDLRRIFNIRNIAAHSIPMLSTDFAFIFSSKKEKPENLDELNREFVEKYRKVKPILTNIVFKLIEERKKNGH